MSYLISRIVVTAFALAVIITSLLLQRRLELTSSGDVVRGGLTDSRRVCV